MHVLSILLTVIEVVVCLLLIGLVLIQRSKGEGLSSAFGGGMGEAIFGANVGNVVTRTTVVLGLVFLLNTIVLSMILTHGRNTGVGSAMDDLPRRPAAEAPASPRGAAMPSAAGQRAPIAPAAATPVAPAPMPSPSPAPAN
jgi:preprotein translocase subunit SecG